MKKCLFPIDAYVVSCPTCTKNLGWYLLNILNIIYYFSPGVKHNDQDGDSFKKQCQLVKDASDFLITVQIPGFIRDCLDHSSAPMDGQTLSDNLHNRGINIRYIGVIANMLSKVPQLSYIHSISVSEVIVRSTKHIFTNFMQGLELTHLSVGIAHFLNCFLSRLVYYTLVLWLLLRPFK